MDFYLINKMSQNEFGFKNEEADIGVERQEIAESYIKNEAIIDFLIQHEPRKDIDLSKIKIPAYLCMDDEEGEEN